MKPADKINNLFENAKITVGPDVDKKILNKATSALPHQTAQPDRHIWSMIMHSKLTKPLAAAIIVIVSILSLTVWDTTVTPAQAMEQMRKAMKDVLWMHSYADTEKIDGKSSEIWLSLSLGIEAKQSDDGYISFTSIAQKETLTYDPNTNTVTLSVSDRNDLYKANSATEFLDLIIETLKGNNHATMTTEQENNNIIYKITIPRGDPPSSVGTEVWQLTTDKKSHLLMRMELEGWDKAGTFMKVADFEFDYPDTGPMNIYELGVPQTASIIDKRPSEDIKTIINHYEATQKKEPTHYTALIIYTRYENNNQIADEATIVYTDGNLQRREQLSLKTELIDSQRKEQLNLIREMGNSLDSMLTWWGNHEFLSRRLAELYDGRYLYSICQHLNESNASEDTNSKSRRKNFNPQSFYRGWTGEADVFRIDSKSPEITLVENDFSKTNNLICLQKLDDMNGAKWHTEQTAYGRRYKRLCYLDPQKDYLCCRLETYLVQDEHWEKDKFTGADKNFVRNPDQSLKYTQLKIREITQYSQTTSGYWYPAEIQWLTKTQRGNGQIEENLSVIKIYLDTERHLQENTFDPETFSHDF